MFADHPPRKPKVKVSVEKPVKRPVYRSLPLRLRPIPQAQAPPAPRATQGEEKGLDPSPAGRAQEVIPVAEGKPDPFKVDPATKVRAAQVILRAAHLDKPEGWYTGPATPAKVRKDWERESLYDAL